MRVLVTGGAGYIGSVAVERLLEASHEVVALDNLSQGHRAAVAPGAAFVEADLCDAAAVEEVFRAHAPFDAVMHFASKSLVPESMRLPALYLRDNVVAGVNLIDAAARHGTHRFILSSTANLFGAAEKMPITEEEPLVPGSPYGESKLTLERALAWYERIHGLRYAALRYFNAAGATERCGEFHEPETHIIPKLFEVALGQAEGFTLFGDDYPTPDGTCIRDYVHVADLVDAHVLALDAIRDRSRAYNLGSGAGFSNREVVEAVRRVTGHPIPVSVGPRRPGDPPALVASSALIERELGWTRRFNDLDKIVATAWEWRRRHPNGYGGTPKAAGASQATAVASNSTNNSG
jgi:UDP-glucose 4-epimerase